MAYNTGATFYPGGDDSYYMPEIVQPAPHRVNEHPTNMHHNVENMEHLAQDRDPRYFQQPNGSPNFNSGGWPQSSSTHDYNQQQSMNSTSPPTHTYQHQGPQPHHQQQQQQQQSQQPPVPPQHQSQYAPSAAPQTYQQVQYSTGLPEQPNFSPFPPIRDPPPNIPPTDDQKEATLESVREAVLSSNDPETQLVWAQDVLAYVEIAQQNEHRISATQPARPRTPKVEHVLREDAVKVVNFLADQHHPKAEFLRGMWLEFGKFGHRIDKKEAFHCYSRASAKGYVRADYRIGMQFESSNDALKAIRYYQKGAESEDSACCYRLGMMTLLGQHGQVQDFARGMDLVYSSARTADENAPQGAYVLGMLQAGDMPQITIPESYLPRNYAAAKVNIEKAAYLGFPKAQVKMGSAYELCELGCSFDPALSLHYNALAARQGEAEAEMSISKWFLCGHDGVFEKNEEIAFTYAQRAAVGGLATAQFAMGYFYEVGIYVPVDFNTAKDWYRKAAQNGNPDANGRVEAIAGSKTLSRKDHESVALKRIRQQYGSAGHDAVPPTLPSVYENPPTPTVDMPDPSRLSINPTPARPPTTTPYPTGPPNMPMASNTPIRPTSAFGINPNLRTNSAAPMPAVRPGPGPYTSQNGQLRPHSSFDASQRFHGYDGRQQSGGPPAPTPVHGLPSQQSRPPPRAGSASPYTQQLNPNQPSGRQNMPAVPGKVDIGFTAPADPHGADRKERPVYGVDPNGGKPLPFRPNNPPRGSSRINTQAPIPTPPSNRDDRPNGHGPRPLPQKQPHAPSPISPVQSMKPPMSQQHNMKPVSPSSMAPPQKCRPPQNVVPAQSVPKVKPNTVKPGATPSKPPGKGPKSFDEMGIPQGKDKGDCIVM